MKNSDQFVRLNKAIHERTTFDCGEVELNEFIQKHAAKHMDIRISTTMVLPAIDSLLNGKYPICAFFTITPGSIKRETLPEDLMKKLPYYPVPVFLIAQMAVHSECQGIGLGKITLVKTLEFLLNVNKYMRAYAVIVDCINDDIAQFYSKYGFEILGYNAGRLRMYLPMKTVEQLF